MSVLPTVKLRRRSDGAIRIVNARDYARDVSNYSGYEIVALKNQNADPATVKWAEKQAEIELERERRPGHPAYTDAQRRQAFRSNTSHDVKTSDAPPVPPVPPQPDPVAETSSQPVIRTVAPRAKPKA